MATPQIGDLRERVALQREVRARDDIGGFESTWTTVATVWARVAPMSASERWMRHQMQAQAAWKLTIRHRTDLSLSPAMRAVWGDRTFELRGITNADERRRFLDLACDELHVAAVEPMTDAGQPFGLLLAITKAA
jgi:SPP1 family predicted phage head-tail adaptor